MTIVTENLSYPALNTIPEYKAEFDKLARFNSELRKAEALNIQLNEARQAEQKRNPHQSDAERIAEVEQLLSGKPVLDPVEQIKQNMALADSLRRAIAAQQIVLRDVGRELSRKAAQRFEAEHKARTKRVVDALRELHAANQSEAALRESIEALGYRAVLPCMRFQPPEASVDPHDMSGGYSWAWHREACEYLTTDEERAEQAQKQAAEGRRKKLATLVAA